MSYDVIVLGGGPGGYVAAERAGQAGLKTLLIEQRALGGTCLNEGCIPSKVLLNSAKIYHYTTEYGRKFGVVCQGSHVDQPAVVARKEKVIHTLVSGVGAAMKASHVEVVNASGMIRGRGDEGIQVEADGKVYTGKNLIIATGSRAFVPPIPGVKEGLASGFVMTNREALALKELPRRLAVIGGGVIGLELAAYYGVVGCETTVIEMMPKIAGPIDDEISALLQKGYEKDGMKFCLKSKVVRIDADGVAIQKTPTVLEELVDTVLVRFQKLHPGVPVEVKLPDDFIVIPMDSMLIQQVLTNLLENAVLHAKGMTCLTLRVFTLGQRAVFEVIDNGCGIPKERLKTLFTGTTLTQDTSSGGKHGMGIGLSVCAAIIKAHGGEIKAESTPGEGTTIRFWLETEEVDTEETEDEQ